MKTLWLALVGCFALVTPVAAQQTPSNITVQDPTGAAVRVGDPVNTAVRVICIGGTCTGGGGGGGGTSMIDMAAFTAGLTAFTPGGGVFNDGLADVTSGTAATARITRQRAMHVNLRDSTGIEITIPSLVDRGAFTGGTTVVAPIGGVFNDALPGLTAGMVAAPRMTALRTLNVGLHQPDANGNEHYIASGGGSDLSTYVAVKGGGSGIVNGNGQVPVSANFALTDSAALGTIIWDIANSGGAWVGTIQIEAPIGNPARVINATTGAILPSTGITAPGKYFLPILGEQSFRAITTIWSSGAATVAAQGIQQVGGVYLAATAPTTGDLITAGGSIAAPNDTVTLDVTGHATALVQFTSLTATAGTIFVQVSPDGGATWYQSPLAPWNAALPPPLPSVFTVQTTNYNRIRVITLTGLTGGTATFLINDTSAANAVTIAGASAPVIVTTSGGPGVVVSQDPLGNPWSVRLQDGSGTNITSTGGALDVNEKSPVGQATMAASHPVVIASNQSAVPVSGTVAVSSVSGTVGVTQSTSPWIVGFNGVAQPVSGTVSATQGTSPWVTNQTQIGSAAYALGQTTMVNSAPVVIASNQSAVPVSGTVAVSSVGGTVAVNGTVTATTQGIDPLSIAHTLNTDTQGTIVTRVLTSPGLPLPQCNAVRRTNCSPKGY